MSKWGCERGRQTQRENMEEKRKKRSKNGARGRSELCLASTCGVAAGGKAPGDSDDGTA